MSRSHRQQEDTKGAGHSLMVVIHDTGPDDVTEVLMQDFAHSRHYSSWWVTKPIFHEALYWQITTLL